MGFGCGERNIKDGKRMEKFHFTKMHGIGNDYVYVDMFEEKIENPTEVAIKVSDRHYGIGSDGLILVAPSEVADVRMIMYNADGSEGAMCGNGIRCVSKFAYDHHHVDKTEITVETKSGIKNIKLDVEDGKAVAATVNMGQAILKPQDIPVNMPGDSVISQEIEVAGKKVRATCVSMGNPHCVVFMKDFWEDVALEDLDLESIGPAFENHELFPDRINTEFVEIIDDKTLKMRVWERGSGETIACGTGSCAVVVAAVENGICKKGEEIKVILRGGDLHDTYKENGEVIMKGSANTVFEGDITI